MASNYTNSDSTENITETSSSSKTKDDFPNEILMCGICLSRMSSPYCLPCAHAFCRSCLLDYAQNNNNNNTSTSIHFILCPYSLDTSKINSDQQPQNQSNELYRTRCHTCCLLKMLKICKHCYFMLCDTCRRAHLLDVHRESKIQLDLFESHTNLIHKKRMEMDKITKEYDNIRERIENYVQKFINEVEKQRDHALQIINERQHLNDEAFWTGNGFDNAKNITDKDLIELSDNLHTMPDVDERLIELIQFSQLKL